jgi:hypothetical protein
VESLYRYVPVWRRESGVLILYRCFEVFGKGYSVQSKDWFRPGDTAEGVSKLERQFEELLAEQAPDERSGVYASLEAAIEAFDADFLRTSGA